MEKLDIKRQSFLNLTFSTDWFFVSAIRSLLKEILNKHYKNIESVSVIIICISELIENSIKYSDNGKAHVSIDFDFENGLVMCQLTNTANEENIKSLKDETKDLNINNIQEVYIKRVERAAESSDEDKSQLGLARVVFDGQTNLDIAFNDNQVIVRTVFSIAKIE